MHLDRIRHSGLHARITSAEEAALLIEDGMTVGMSGFTRAGDCKSVPAALARRASAPLSITLITGALLGHDTDKMLAQANALARRMPFQVDTTLRRKINQGEIAFIDQHLSETAEQLRAGHIGPVDVAIIEAAAITESGAIVPTMSVGNSASFALQAKRIIIELNVGVPAAIEGLHDIYVPQDRPAREPIGLMAVDQRIGKPYIEVDPSRIAAIVVTEKPDSPSNALPPDDETNAIAGHINFPARRGQRRPVEQRPVAAAGRHRHHRQRGAARFRILGVRAAVHVFRSAAGQRHRAAGPGQAAIRLGLVHHRIQAGLRQDPGQHRALSRTHRAASAGDQQRARDRAPAGDHRHQHGAGVRYLRQRQLHAWAART